MSKILLKKEKYDPGLVDWGISFKHKGFYVNDGKYEGRYKVFAKRKSLDGTEINLETPWGFEKEPLRKQIIQWIDTLVENEKT